MSVYGLRVYKVIRLRPLVNATGCSKVMGDEFIFCIDSLQCVQFAAVNATRHSSHTWNSCACVAQDTPKLCGLDQTQIRDARHAILVELLRTRNASLIHLCLCLSIFHSYVQFFLPFTIVM